MVGVFFLETRTVGLQYSVRTLEPACGARFPSTAYEMSVYVRPACPSRRRVARSA